MNDNEFDRAQIIDAWKNYFLSGTRGEFNKSFAWAARELDELVQEQPNEAFDLVLEILASLEDEELYPALAAGEVEELLVVHGEKMISLYEKHAKTNAKFKKLLGGVWHHDINPGVWARIQALNIERW